MRRWIVFEHAGGREISHTQHDAWKQPLLVVPLQDIIDWMREEATRVDERSAVDLVNELQGLATGADE